MNGIIELDNLLGGLYVLYISIFPDHKYCTKNTITIHPMKTRPLPQSISPVNICNIIFYMYINWTYTVNMKCKYTENWELYCKKKKKKRKKTLKWL